MTLKEHIAAVRKYASEHGGPLVYSLKAVCNAAAAEEDRCPECDGVGAVFRSREEETCHVCGGSGSKSDKWHEDISVAAETDSPLGKLLDPKILTRAYRNMDQ